MKKIFKLTMAFAAVAIMAGMGNASAQKLGYIDTNLLLQAMPEMAQVQANVEKLADDMGEQFDLMQVEYNKKMEDYRKSSSTWTDGVRQIKEQEINDQMQRLQQFQEKANEDITVEQRKQMAPILEKAREAITAVSKANAMTFVFDISMGTVSYYDENSTTDILPLVKKHLGIN